MRTLILLSLMLSGCRTIHYTSPDGHRISYANFGFNTSVDELTVEKSKDGTKATLKGAKSDASAAYELAGKLADKLPVP